MRLLSLFLLAAATLLAQSPPVVLLNGFDTGAAAGGNCDLEPDSTGTFGRLQEFLEAEGRTVHFFDNCAFGTPSIEVLGAELGNLLATFDQPADVIGFSMGGLIIRAYLAGKLPDADTSFAPPADLRVRKAIFVATPHFGSPLASFAPPGLQAQQLEQGSRFTLELARWHQGLDDLRELDAIAIVGDGGLGRAGDGVVSLVSASLSSFRREPARTRVLEACHNVPAFLICDINEAIMEVADPADPTAAIILSFLDDTPDWQSIGTPIDQHPSGEAGVYFATQDAQGNLDPTPMTAQAVPEDALLAEQPLASNEPGIFFSRELREDAYLITPDGSSRPTRTQLTAGATATAIQKPGPLAVRAIPAAGVVETLSLAPDSLISLFGEHFTPDQASEAATTLPLPVELAGVRLLANGDPIGLLFANDGQINAHLPDNLSGLITLTAETAEGQSTINVLISESALAVFAQNGGGTGPAAAIDAITGALNTPDAAAPIGGFVSLFVTGLGNATPTVTLGGVQQTVLFAGPAPGFLGLQQINIEIQPGTPTGDAVELRIAAAARPSNTTTLAVAP